MMLDGLLRLLPGLRRLRSLNADWLRTLLNRQRGQCTWCGRRVPSGSRTWCGPQCVAAFKQRCCPQAGLWIVTERDRGICQACGRDTVAAEQEAKRRDLVEFRWRSGELRHEQEAREKKRASELAALGFARGCWREVDHTVPVCEGGGLCGPDGLRLLCGVCHKRATAALARRRKDKSAA